MRTRFPAPRGATLLEAMFAMAIVMLGGAGAFSLQRITVGILGDSRRVTRATTYAQDLVEQIQTWPWGDPRLVNRTTSNDADLGDSAYQFQIARRPVVDGLADFGEGDLAAGPWSGLDGDLLEANSQGNERMERFWNVGPLPDANGNGVADGVLVMVIVRWPHQGGWRRMVIPTVKKNPADF